MNETSCESFVFKLGLSPKPLFTLFVCFTEAKYLSQFPDTS